ncbi:MAG: hypothetical protein KAR00_00715 [Candidatus Pacebacteria bacterium]|nr:hypothetical protein [Candidatus Paceibacterota bacterium]
MRQALLERKKRYHRDEMVQPLAYALWSAGKMAFELKSVERYMEKKAWQFRISEKEISYSLLIFLIVAGMIGTSGLCLIINQPALVLLQSCLLIVSFIILTTLTSTVIDAEKLTSKEKITAYSAMAFFFLGGGWLVYVIYSFCGPKTKEWAPFLLKHYDKRKLPSFVLETIGEVGMRCPEAKFVVFELDNDPILLVKLEKEKYYIEAWSEPSFKGKRIA